MVKIEKWYMEPPSRPRSLASMLAGQTKWDSPEVGQELKLLFGAGDARAFNDYMQTVWESLWQDAYFAHEEFLCQVKRYYSL